MPLTSMKCWSPRSDSTRATPWDRPLGAARQGCAELSVAPARRASPGREPAQPDLGRPLARAARGLRDVLVWGIALVLALSPQAADLSGDPGELPPPSKRKNVSFGNDIKSLFDRSCVKCHSGEKAKGRLRLDSRESVLKGGESGAAIVSGNSEQSKLVFYVADLVPEMQMPPLAKRGGFPALTKEQVGLVRAWIDQGAK